MVRKLLSVLTLLFICHYSGCSSVKEEENCKYDTDCPGLKVCRNNKCVNIESDAGLDSGIKVEDAVGIDVVSIDSGGDIYDDGIGEVDIGDIGNISNDVSEKDIEGSETLLDVGEDDEEGNAGDTSFDGGESGDAGGDGGGNDVGGSFVCPEDYIVPAGTTIIDIGDKDYYANKDFDTVFDNPGSTFDSAVGANETKALKFTNTMFLAGFISGTAGNYGRGYKDWSISLCPGDFSASLPTACLKTSRESANMYYSTDGSQGCTIPVNTPVYLNIRSSVSGTPAGFVLQNVKQADLP